MNRLLKIIIGTTLCLGINLHNTNVNAIKDLESNTSIKTSFAELGKPRAMDEYWYKMARCETNSNWQDKGRYAGGLGIMTNGKYGDYYMGTWERWGGEEFASSPDKATKEQQILVANRVSTQGWYQPDGKYKEPVGFNGWGCKKHIGSPVLVTEPPYNYIFKKYKTKEYSRRVKILQTILGNVAIDGYYGPKTSKAHQEFLNALRTLNTVKGAGINS